MRQYMVDDTNGNCAHQLNHIALDGFAQAQDVRYIKAASMPTLTIRTMSANPASLQLEVNLEPHAFCLITLTEL